MRFFFLALAVLGLSAISSASAIAQRAVPAPSWARSVEVIADGAVIYQSPSSASGRRGTVRLGTRLPLRGRTFGDGGCNGNAWIRISREGFVCSHRVQYSAEAPGGTPVPALEEGELLPHVYAFVGFDGTPAYANPSDHYADDYIETLGEGFGVIVVEQRNYHGTQLVRTRRGLWIERSSLRYARGSDFAGAPLVEGAELNVAWVLREGATVHERARGRTLRRASRRAIVHVAEVERRDWVRLTDGTYMRDRDLGRTTVSTRPESIADNERWIDIDVAEQVMVAYQGDRPTFATLVSTGRARRSHATPIGEFRIWIKLSTSNMDDLERTDVSSNYSIEGVPWVQYFERSNGFHAAFWHDDFGRRRSHGCINLSPHDARWLYQFTGPQIPDGWIAMFPTDMDRGTMVRVRDGDVVESSEE